MELVQVIDRRISIRAFRPDPVPKETLTELLRIACKAPSGVNKQPWEFFVVRGEALERFRRANVSAYREGRRPSPELPVSALKGVAPSLSGRFRERQVALAKQIFEALGIARDDHAGKTARNESMLRFYDAPAVIILVVDRVLDDAWPIIDIGLVSQNICLAALEYGLGTCIMRAVVDYPEIIREVAAVPESKRIIVGIAIGYPDQDHPVNRLKSPREKIEDLVTFVE
jgi:nitroreductase